MFERLSKKRQEEGFTLIELLIVIVILGILAAVVVFAVSGITDRGKSAACKSDVKTLETAAEAYYAKKSAHAASGADLVSEGFVKSYPPSSDEYDVVYTGGGVVKSGAEGSAADTTKMSASDGGCPAKS